MTDPQQPPDPVGDDQPTTQLRRLPPAPPPAPLPGPLDLAGRTATPPGRAPVAADATQVLSIHELMDVAAEPEADLVPAPEAGVAPVAPGDGVDRVERPVSRTIQDDAGRIVAEVRTRLQGWLRDGDNVLIVATVAVLLLLVITVSAV